MPDADDDREVLVPAFVDPETGGVFGPYHRKREDSTMEEAIIAAGRAVAAVLIPRYYCPCCGTAGRSHTGRGTGHTGPCPLLALHYLIQHYDEEKP